MSRLPFKQLGIASDHGGYELKAHLTTLLRWTGAEVIDFGNHQFVEDDDDPDFVVPSPIGKT